MGNSCTCNRNIIYKYNDVKLVSLGEQIQNDKENEQLEDTNLYNIVKYFNEGEKEINTKIEKQKVKRKLSHKKAKKLKSFNKNNDSKYELMLKRLLEQKQIEMKGPKRRNTIGIDNNKDLIKLIEIVKKENEINKIKKDNKENDKNNDNQKRVSILLNIKDKIKFARQSVSINKFERKVNNNNFEETEISNSTFMNDKNINYNSSYYISDGNYACIPGKYLLKNRKY